MMYTDRDRSGSTLEITREITLVTAAKNVRHSGGGELVTGSGSSDRGEV